MGDTNSMKREEVGLYEYEVLVKYVGNVLAQLSVLCGCPHDINRESKPKSRKK